MILSGFDGYLINEFVDVCFRYAYIYLACYLYTKLGY